MTKLRYFLLLLVLCLSLSGCLQVKQDMTIRDDGSVTVITTLVGADVMQGRIKNAREMLEADEIRDYKDETTGMWGFEAVYHDKSLEDFHKRAHSLGRVDGKAYNISKEEGWFTNKHILEIIASTPGGGGNRQLSGDRMTVEQQAKANHMAHEFTIRLPRPSDYNNADTVSDEGKTLHWNLASTYGGHICKMQVQYKSYNTTRIILTGAVALLLLVLFALYRRKKNLDPDSEEQKKNNRLMLAVGVLAFIILDVAAFPYFMNKFNVADKVDALKLHAQNLAQRVTGEGVNVTQADKSNVTTETKELPQGKVEYPIIHLENKEVEERINTSVKKQIDGFVQDAMDYGKTELSITYDIKANNDSFYSLVISYRSMEPLAPRVAVLHYGLVYDKTTGIKESLENYKGLTVDYVLKAAEKELYDYEHLNVGPIPPDLESLNFYRRDHATVIQPFFFDEDGNMFIMFFRSQLVESFRTDAPCVRIKAEELKALHPEKFK